MEKLDIVGKENRGKNERFVQNKQVEQGRFVKMLNMG